MPSPGVRVFDIRDPAAPKEIAYYNTGTVPGPQPVADFAASPPVIRRDLGQIWWVTLYGGLHVAQFRPGVWPFAGDPACPSPDDYFAVQYGSCSPPVTAGAAPVAATPTTATRTVVSRCARLTPLQGAESARTRKILTSVSALGRRRRFRAHRRRG